MSYTIALKEKEAVTHDVTHFRFEKPEGFEFTPGQATELAMLKEGWKDEGRPFTFTSQPEDATLDFVIKSYPEEAEGHDGMTAALPDLEPGDEVSIEEPFGAISDQGPGVFLAAGAGITPFIPILRRRARDGKIDGCTLIFSNKTADDIILQDEWEAMEGLTTHFTATEEKDDSISNAKVDRAYLEERLDDFDQVFYICGPQGFVDDVRKALISLGAKEDRIVTEEGW